MVKKGGIEIFRNNWNRNRKSFSRNPSLKAVLNGNNTSQNKECNINGQQRHLRCKMFTAPHSHHKPSIHLQGLFYKKLGVLVCIQLD